MMKDKILWALSRARYVQGLIHGRKAFVGPYTVTLELTDLCNYACVGCFPHRKGNGLDKSLGHMPLDSVLRIIASAGKMGSSCIELSGYGEPMLHPNLPEIIQQVNRFGMSCSLTTNGSLMSKETLVRFKKLGLIHMTISLWTFNRALYSQLHETSSDFLNQIEQVLKERKKEDSPIVTGYMVIAKPTISVLKHDLIKAAECGLDDVTFNILRPKCEKDLEHCFCNEMDLMPEVDLLYSAYAYAQKLKIKTNLKNLIFRLEALRALEKGEGRRSQQMLRQRMARQPQPCYAGWHQVYVQLDGKVIPCCGMSNHHLGNIFEQPLEKIFFGQGFDDFRGQAAGGKKGSLQNLGCFRACASRQAPFFLRPLMEVVTKIRGLCRK